MKLLLLCLSLLSHYSFAGKQTRVTTYLVEQSTSIELTASSQKIREALRAHQEKFEDEKVETLPYREPPLVRTKAALDLIDQVADEQAYKKPKEDYDWHARKKQIRKIMRGKKQDTSPEAYLEFDLEDLVRIAVQDLKLKHPKKVAEALRRLYKRDLSFPEAASMFAFLKRLEKES